jgi:glycogen debranching enzyme
MNRRDSFTVWTDSPNSFYHRNGRLPGPQVAPISLQALVYDSLVAMARHREETSRSRRSASALRRQADAVKASVLRHYVVTDQRGTFLANGVDRGTGGAVKPMAVRAIDMGFALDSELLAHPSDARLVSDLVQHLVGPDMLTPVGIAGKAKDEVRFEKFDYHSQVWAFAVHRVARGLRRHGILDLATDLDTRMLRQTADGLLPENVGAGEELEYCPHILTVERLAANGRRTHTVKERTPAPFAAWTAGAVIAAQARKAGPGSDKVINPGR